MLNTTYRNIGLTICLVAGLSAALPAMPSYAQTTPNSSAGSGLLDPSSFLSNPQSLLTAPGGISANALNLLGDGSNSQMNSLLGSTLASMPGSQANATQATSLLQSIGGGVDLGALSPETATQLISGIISNPQLTQALLGQQNLGNLAGGIGDIQNLLSNPAITNALAGKSPMEQAAGIDQILNTAIAGGSEAMSPAAQQAVAEQIKEQMPELAEMLEQLGPLEEVVGGMLDQLGGLFAGLFGGSNPSSSPSSSSSSSSGGREKDTGNYELKSKPVRLNPVYKACGPCNDVAKKIADHYEAVRQKLKNEFIKHRRWIVNTYWKEHILPALMLMAEQLSVVGIAQVEMIGAMLDAKHQLETQRLFQQLTAQAHKDYHPSEGMCTFGTTVRSLAASERKSDLTQVAMATRMMNRQTMSGDVVSFEGEVSDSTSRMMRFTTTYCDKSNNANGLEQLCKDVNSAPQRRNIDVDYTRNIESRLTLDVDLTKDDAQTEDQEDLFALAANLYSNNIAPKIDADKLANDKEQVRQDGAERLLDLRAIYAKRSVAQNSFAAITAMRSAGDEGSAPYTKALIKELGITSTDEIEKILGKNPSYFAQMEVLTKKIYQNPTFYTELYDKPVNVERKGAAIEAISLMQDRDLYNSLLRTEAVLSVLLETMLAKEQAKVVNAMPEGSGSGAGGSGGGGQ